MLPFLFAQLRRRVRLTMIWPGAFPNNHTSSRESFFVHQAVQHRTQIRSAAESVKIRAGQDKIRASCAVNRLAYIAERIADRLAR